MQGGVLLSSTVALVVLVLSSEEPLAMVIIRDCGGYGKQSDVNLGEAYFTLKYITVAGTGEQKPA